MYKIDIGISHDVPDGEDEFDAYFAAAKMKIKYHLMQLKLKQANRIKTGITPIYILPSSLKTQIRHHISIIRERLDAMQLPQLKKEILFTKLDAFAAEVDRDRTRLEAAVSAYIWVKREVKGGAEVLKPIMDQIEKILDKFAKAKELMDALPGPKGGGEIEAPPKELPAPDHGGDNAA